MPSVECRLIIDIEEGASGAAFCAELEAFLTQHGYNVATMEYVGTTLTQDEIDELRWKDESPQV